MTSKKQKLRRLLGVLKPDEKALLAVDDLRDEVKAIKIPDYTLTISAIKDSIIVLKQQLDKKIESVPEQVDYTPQINTLNNQLNTIATQLKDELEKSDSVSGQVLVLQENHLAEIEKLTKELQKVHIEALNKGGGNMNRQIRVEGVDVLTKYTDINLYGVTSSVIASVDNTNKRVDIGIQGGSGGGGISSVLAGTGIVVDNSTPSTPTVTLGDTSVTTGTYGSAITVPRITVDQQGRISAASTVGITFPTNDRVSSVVAGTGIDVNNSNPIAPVITRASIVGDISVPNNSNTATLASIITAGGPIGSSTVIPIITYDAKGRLTAVSSVASSGGSGTPGGANAEIQYNDGGAFGASSTLTWNKNTSLMGIGTAAPGAKLHVVSSGATPFKVTDSEPRDRLVINDNGSTVFSNAGGGFGDSTEFISTLSHAVVNISTTAANMYTEIGMGVAFYSGAYRVTSNGNFETRASGNVDFYVIGTSKYTARFSGDGLFIGNEASPVDPTAKLDINGDKIRLRTAKTPASASAAGNQGDICWDSDYIYVCIATNTWKRVAIATW